jgi:hypothetical protein
LVKVQETIEEALAGVRDGLAKMENDVERLNALLFEADFAVAMASHSAAPHRRRINSAWYWAKRPETWVSASRGFKSRRRSPA